MLIIFNINNNFIDKSIIKKVFISFLFLLTIFFICSSTLMAQDNTSNKEVKKIKINGEKVSYINEEKKAKISGDVKAILGKYHFKAEEINIKLAEDSDGFFNVPESINMETGSFSGCDYDEPHYYFEAKNIEIKPDEYLKAYNVVFYELKGKLPLFYFPYLYINLSEDEQKIVPEFGYSSIRGWYAKLTYNHELIKNLPGQLYLGYYEKSGEIAGFKQHFLYTPYHQAYVRYLHQKNNINSSNIAQDEIEVAYNFEKNEWNSTLRLNNRIFLDYDHFFADLEIINSKKEENTSFISQYDEYDYDDDSKDRIDKKIKTSYDRDFENGLSLDLEYDFEEENYLNNLRNDEKEIDFNFSANKSFNNGLDLLLGYKRNLDYDGNDDLNDEIEGNFVIDYNWARNWSYDLDYEYGELRETAEMLKTRESGKTKLAYNKNNFEINTILERYEPNFSDEEDDNKEDNVSYFRLPEFNLEYSPSDPMFYRLQLGNYYEDESGTEGYRAGTEIEYNNKIQPYEFISLQAKEKLIGRAYEVKETEVNYYDPYQVISESQFGVNNYFGDHLEISNNYLLTLYKGKSPFDFDQAQIEELIESSLKYEINDKINFQLESGYDIYNQDYLPLKTNLRYLPFSAWIIKAALEYDFKQQEFSDELVMSSNYRTDKLEADTTLKYNLNKKQLNLLENTLVYEVKGDWGWYIENNISYDFEEDIEDRLEKANLTLKKKFHCREVKFSYDYLKEEIRVGYQINLMPSKGIEVGKDNKDGFLFKLGEEEVK